MITKMILIDFGPEKIYKNSRKLMSIFSEGYVVVGNILAYTWYFFNKKIYF